MSISIRPGVGSASLVGTRRPGRVEEFRAVARRSVALAACRPESVVRSFAHGRQREAAPPPWLQRCDKTLSSLLIQFANSRLPVRKATAASFCHKERASNDTDSPTLNEALRR